MEKHTKAIEENLIFKSLVQAVPDIIYIIDENGNFSFVNDAVYKLGYQPSELIGRHISTILPNGDIDLMGRDHVLVQFVGVATGDEKAPKLIDERRTGRRITKNLSLRLKPKDSDRKRGVLLEAEAVAVGLHAAGWRSKKKRFLGTIGVIKDISELKKTQQTLVKTITYYEMLIKNIPSIIYILAADSTLLYTSPSIERVQGYGLYEIVGESGLDFVHPEDRHLFDNVFTEDIPDGQEQRTVECRLRHKDGRWRLFDVSMHRIVDAQGRLMCFIFYLADITGRRAAEEELRNSERRFRMMVESATDIIYRFRLFPDKGFDYISPAVEAVFGHRQEEFYEDKGILLRLAHPDHRDLLESMPSTGADVKRGLLIKWVLEDGREICTEQSNVPVTDETGRLVAVEGIARDVTERIKIEDRLKKSLREKEILLTEIHHRVKNNMQIISSLLSLQAQNISDPSLLDAYRDTQNRILSMALIHNIMYASRNLARIDFNDYIQKLVGILLGALSASPDRVAVEINVKDVELDINKAIPCGLIINEIVSNALKHAFPAGSRGEISIQFHRATPDEYTLAIRDNGVGMPGGMDMSAVRSTGINIIKDLTDQLKGTVRMTVEGGTAYLINFPAGDTLSL
jgi:PAS domain S-box-containing protein